MADTIDAPISPAMLDAAPGLLAGCEATLLYLQTARWEAQDERQWIRLTGSPVPTVDSLRAFIRRQVDRAQGKGVV
jgi:hypothetical protein